MSTTKKRINISLPRDVEKVLTTLAQRDDVPTATKAIDLIRLALAVDADDVWDQLASERDTKNARFIVHKKAWA